MKIIDYKRAIMMLALVPLFAPAVFDAAALQPTDDQTECRADLVLVFWHPSKTFVCVIQETADRWAEHGLAVAAEDYNMDTAPDDPMTDDTMQEMPAATDQMPDDNMDTMGDDTDESAPDAMAAEDMAPDSMTADTMQEPADAPDEMSGDHMEAKEMDNTMLLVQSSDIGTIIHNTETDNHVLTLSDVASTVYLTHMPEMSGVIATSELTPMLASADMLDASVIITRDDSSKSVISAEMRNPSFSTEGNNLAYEISILSMDGQANDGLTLSEAGDILVLAKSSACILPNSQMIPGCS